MNYSHGLVCSRETLSRAPAVGGTPLRLAAGGEAPQEQMPLSPAGTIPSGTYLFFCLGRNFQFFCEFKFLFLGARGGAGGGGGLPPPVPARAHGSAQEDEGGNDD